MAETPVSGASNPSSSSSSSLGSRNNNNPNYHQLNLAGEFLSLNELNPVGNTVQYYSYQSHTRPCIFSEETFGLYRGSYRWEID